MHAQLFSAATGLIFGWSLHIYPYFVDVNREDYGLTIHLHRLQAYTFAQATGVSEHLLLVFKAFSKGCVPKK